MAKIFIVLVATLVAAVVADPIRNKRSDQLIVTAGAAATQGAGWAADNHQAIVTALGSADQGGWGQPSGWGQDAGSGWGGVPAHVNLANAGNSEVGSAISITEVTSNDGNNNLGVLQTVNAENIVDAGDLLEFDAGGVQVDSGSSSAAAAGGWGSIDAAGDSAIIADGTTYGMGKP